MNLNKIRNDYRRLLVVLVLGLVSFGVSGGCSDNNSGGNSEADQAVAIFLGDHRQNQTDQISTACNISNGFRGKLNHIIVDGLNLSQLSKREIGVIQDAYDQGYMIIVYEITEAQIEDLYNLIDHPTKYSEDEQFSFLDENDEGENFAVYIVERFGALNSSSTLLVGGLPPITLADGNTDPETGFTEVDNDFRVEAFHICELIDEQQERIEQAIEDGLIDASAEEVLTKYGLLDEFEAQLQNVSKSSVQSGTLTNIASADIHTGYIRIGYGGGDPSPATVSGSDVNTYTFTNKVWTLTADTFFFGLNPWILVDQSMNIDSSNGFIQDEVPSEPVTGTVIDAVITNAAQGWYLSELEVENTVIAGSGTIGGDLISVNSSSPDTSDNSVTSSTSSLDSTISGTIAVDLDGDNVASTGGVTWTTADTFSKTDIAITNNSSAPTDSGAIATWKYELNQAQIGGSTTKILGVPVLAACKDFSLTGLADLSHGEFTPDQAFIFVLDPRYIGETVKINTLVTGLMETTIKDGSSCNDVGCSCSVNREITGLEDILRGDMLLTFIHSISIPQAPEGPAGDDTCSDGFDNDKDGNTDSADSQC